MGRYSLIIIVCLAASSELSAQIGPPFDLSHSVVAGGGGSNSSNGTFNVSGTSGQPVAGTVSNNGSLILRGGFWDYYLGPTAALASISGRVITSTGQGIRGVRVTLTSPDGAIRRTTTSSFGYYAFDGVEVGNTYVLVVAAKHYAFTNSTRVFSLQDNVTEMDFVASP